MIATRPCIMHVNLDAITHNIRLYESITHKTVFGVVKANAYGHGDIEVARHLERLGIQVLCVSSLDEALHLYSHGISSDILIFGPTDPEAIKQYHKPQFIYTISSLDYFKSLPEDLDSVRFHIEINTGMNRLGIRTHLELQEILVNQHFQFEGIYTHFSSADEITDFTDTQYTRFKQILDGVNHTFKWIHAGNTHGSLSHHDSFVNAQRIGIGMYGFVDSEMFSEFSQNLQLAMTLEAKIIHIDTIKKGEPVGYNRTYIAKKDLSFGTLPIGYADGLNPLNQKLPLQKNGRPLPILGKICMDQLMIEVSPEDKVGDWVEIVGPHRTPDAIAQLTGTIPYVVMAQLNDRITRQYSISGNIIATMNFQNN